MWTVWTILKAACIVEFALIPQRMVRKRKEDSDINSNSETVEEKALKTKEDEVSTSSS